MNNNVVVKINGAITPDVQKGIPFQEELSNALDIATIVFISSNANTIPIFSDVEIAIDGISKYYLVNSSLVVNISKGFPTYKHTVGLIEPTKYLEKILLPNQNFTGDKKLIGGSKVDKTMLDHVENALINAEIIPENLTCRFSLSSRLRNALANVKAEDAFFTNPTLREVLDGLLSVLDYRARINRINNMNSIVIDYMDLNPTGSSIDITEKVYEENRQDAEYSSQSLRINVEDAIHATRKTIVHGWDVFKSTDGSDLTSDNAGVILPFPIESLVKFEVRCKLMLTKIDGNRVIDVEEQRDIDITDHVYDSEYFALLSASEKEKSISYQRGSSTINTSARTKKILFSITALSEAIRTKASSEVSSDNSYIGCSSVITTNLLYRIEYVPYVDLIADISETIVEDNLKKTSQAYGQSDRNINIERYGRHVKNQAERIGNETKTIDRIHSTLSELYNLGDRLGSYVIASRDYSISDDFIKAHYVAVKNFANSQIKISLNREKRVYNIPIYDYTRRDILIHQYCILSLGGVPKNKSILSTIALEHLKLGWKNGSNAEIKKAYLRTDVMAENEYYLMDCYSYNLANSIIISFACMDNYSAGYGTGKKTLGGRKIIINPYCDSLGNYSKFQIVYACGTHNYDNASLANMKTYAEVLPLAQIGYSAIAELMSPLEYYKCYKDAFSHDTFNTQIEFIAESDNREQLIIGDAIAKYNALIGTAKQLYIYPSDKFYMINENKVCKNDRTRIAVKADKVIIDSDEIKFLEVPSNCTSWALGTEDRELLFAVNARQKQIYMSFYHKFM